MEARAALADELLELLPPDHPIIEVLRTATMFSVGGREVSDAEVAESLARLRLRVLPGEEDGGLTGAEPSAEEEFDKQVQARLLGLPFLSPDEVRGHDIDPGDSRLIRLPRPDRGIQLPALNWNAAGEPWPVVQEVNQHLDAGADPWGVTCWWVDPHARLGAAPAELLGQGRDALLRRAAAALGEDH